jgi:hypothetical protein
MVAIKKNRLRGFHDTASGDLVAERKHTVNQNVAVNLIYLSILAEKFLNRHQFSTSSVSLVNSVLRFAQSLFENHSERFKLGPRSAAVHRASRPSHG